MSKIYKITATFTADISKMPIIEMAEHLEARLRNKLETTEFEEFVLNTLEVEKL